MINYEEVFKKYCPIVNKYEEALQIYSNVIEIALDNQLVDEDYSTFDKARIDLQEAIEKAKKYDEYLRNKHISLFDKMNDTKKTIDSVERERDEALKCVEELKQQNKMLMDGVKVLNNHITIKRYHSDNALYIDVERPILSEEDYNEIKAMLEVVENGC